eukprot:TRINITY_DN36057_c0_g1_i1.p2 TRINITY_DN36057_c0_g1~~TRINITY_DN36057_c0_g1_i1.p2  ORF type:complete len:148 (-),score=26.15 TRINITY_DN36057_c0_g1_i1:188-631(-)
MLFLFFFFQAEDGIRDHAQSRGLGDVYKRQINAEYMGYQPMFSNCREFIRDKRLMAQSKSTLVDQDVNRTVNYIDDARLYQTNTFDNYLKRGKRSESVQARPIHSAQTSQKRLYNDFNNQSNKQILIGNKFYSGVVSNGKYLSLIHI